MSDITANVSFSNISVTTTPSNITVTDDSNNIVNVTTTNSLITVGSTTTNVTVANVATISNVILRQALSAVDTGGDGSFTYSNVTGVFTYTGPSPAEVRSHFSVTDTGGDGSLAYDNGTGVFTYTGPTDADTRTKIDAVNEPANVVVDVIQYNDDSQNGFTSGDTILLEDLPKEWANGTYVSFANSTNPALASINGLTLQVGNIDQSLHGTLINRTTPTLYTSWPSTPFFSGIGGGNPAQGLTAEYTQISKGNVSYSSANGIVSYAGVTLDDIIDIVNFPGSEQKGDPYMGSIDAISPIQWYGYGNTDQLADIVENTYGKQYYKQGDLIFNGNLMDFYIRNRFETKESLANESRYSNNYAGSHPTVGFPNDLGSDGTNKVLNLSMFENIAGAFATNPLGAQIAHGTITDDIQEINYTGGFSHVMKEYTITMVQDSTGGHNFTSNVNINGNVSLDVANGHVVFLNDISSLDTDPGALNLINIKLTNSISDGSNTLDQRSSFENFYALIEINTKDSLGLTNAQAQSFIQDNGLNGSGNIATTGVVTFGNSATQTHNFTGNVNVTGNIEVDGNLNYRNVEDLYVQDQSITLNANATTDATVEIIANRPVAGANTVLRWNETDDKWQFSNNGSTYKDLVSNTDVVAHINGNGLSLTTSMATLAAIDFNNLVDQAINMKDRGKIRITSGSVAGNISQSNNPISSDLPGKMNYYSLKDESNQISVDPEFDKGVEVYTDDDDGIKQVFAKGRGSIASPAGPNDGDRIFDEYFLHHNGTDYKSRNDFGQAGRFVFYDADVATYDANTMPLTQEFFAFNNGDLTTGDPKSLLRLAADGTISFNGDATREDFTSATATITADGSFNSNSNITAVGNISGNYFLGNGSLLTGVSGLTNAQVQAFIEADGLDMTGNMTFTGADIVMGSLTIDSSLDGRLHYVREPAATDDEIILKSEAYTTRTNSNEFDFYKGGGSAASPSVIGNNDTVHHSGYWGYDGTQFSSLPNAGYWVFYDRDTDTGIGANNVPLAHEWYVNPTAGSGSFQGSVLKLTPDKRVVFQNTGTRGFGNNRGLASIEADGNIHTQQGLSANNSITTTAGSISGPTLTDTVLSINSGAITSATTGTFSGQVQAGTFTDGSFSVTGGDFTTVASIGATGNIETNGNIISYSAGGFIGNFNGDGSNISGLTTDIVSEATNLYYTDARSRAAVSVTSNTPSGNGSLTYDNGTGVFTFTPADASGGGISNADAKAYIEANGLNATANIETSTFFIGDLDGAVVLDVNNNTGVTLTKGQAVYLTGGNQGDNPNVALADADDVTKMPALGIVRENIADAAVGQVVTSGEINYSSHGFTLGADLFISTTAGALTETAPTGESGLIQKIGKVVGANHILVQGAFRTNATPNLDENNIFIGNAANRATTVALDNLTQNIKTTGNLQVNPDTDAGQGLLGLTFDTSVNRLGLGTQTPATTIDIVCDDDNEADIMMTEYDSNTGGPDLIFRKANGDKTTPTVLDTGDRLGLISYKYWLHDNPTNPDDGTGDFGFDAITQEVFADGNHGVNDTLTVASYDGSTDPDQIVLSDASYSVGDGTQFLITGTTNANLTSLNNTIVYVDRTGVSGSRVYKLYSDSGLTTPINLGTGSEAPSGMQIATPSTKQPVGLSFLQTIATTDGSFVQNATKLRANGTIEFGAASDRDTDGAEASITKEGVFTTAGNITTTANVSGNYVLGNASQVTGVNLFETIAVSGQTDVVADSISDTLTLAAGSGMTITTDAANDTITFESTGGGGSYGNTEVANFLDSDTMTANIEFTGNLLVGAPAANANIAASNFFGNTANFPDDVDQVQFASAPGWSDGTAVTFNSTTNSNLLFLNGTTYYVYSRSSDTFALYTDVGGTTPSQSGLGMGEAVSGLQGEYTSVGVSQANIEGPIEATNVFAANALFSDVIYPYTSGSTIGFAGVRMSDVGLGGSAGNDFFWPETGRPNAGSLLIAGAGGSGYWAQGVVLENETLTSPVLANISTSTTNYQGSDSIYRRSRGNISAPTAIIENSGSTPDIITSVKYQGHDGTDYQPSFFSNVYVDGAVSTGNMPLAMEISTWENGDSTKTNSGFGFPIVKFRSDRSLEFNSPNPLNYNNPQGNANITADGSFNTNASIVAQGDITTTNLSVTGTSITTANTTLFTIGTDPDHKLEIQAEHARLKFEADVDSPHLQVYTYRNGTVGGTREYYRSSGSAASPTAIGNNDIVLNEEWFGHDGTSFGSAGRPNANFQVFQDDTVGTSTGVVPLSMEWTVNPTGHGGSTFGQSCIKIASNRTLHLQDVNTRGFSGAYDGNVQIVEDGSITTKANVTVGDRLKLKSYSNTEITALSTPSAGEMVYNSTDNLVAYYDGTNWRNIAQGAIVT